MVNSIKRSQLILEEERIMFIQICRRTVNLADLFVAMLLLSTANAHAVPSFARQMGMECSGCHTVFPELTSFGRQFKLRGFTLGNALDDKKFPLNLPLSAVVVASRNSTSNTNTPGVMPENFPRDAQAVLQTAGLYYGGRIAGNFGALVQYNYDGIEHTSKIEMADIRYANQQHSVFVWMVHVLRRTATGSDWEFPQATHRSGRWRIKQIPPRFLLQRISTGNPFADSLATRYGL